MNEEELKNLWQTDQTTPTIDFAKLQTSLDDWQAKLRRKTRVDMWTQGITSALTLIPIYIYPRMIFASAAVIAIGFWYVRELRGLSEVETKYIASFTVTQILAAKIKRMEGYFRHTRFVMYVLTPLIFHVAVYGLGHYDRLPNDAEWTSRLIRSLIFSTILFEVLILIATEIYFKILYTPALDELKKLFRQLNFDE